MPLPRSALRSRLRSFLPIAIGIAAIVALVVGVDPREFAHAIARFRLWLLPVALAAAMLAVLLQGVRWHFLLRELGVPLRLRDSVLLSVAGQAITAILPLGDLTRAIFATEAVEEADFGTVAATVTVQELTFTLLLVMLALPAVVDLHQSPAIIVVTAAGILGVLAILTMPPVFHVVHLVVSRTPLLRRFLSQVDELQHETVQLLHRPDTLGWSVLDLLRALVSIGVFWLVLQGLEPGAVGWWKAAFVLAVSYVGGAVSLIPGGAGVNEATTVGALLLLGLPPGTAAAAAILQRVLVTGTATVMGLVAYAIARRRFHLSGLGALRARARARGRPDRRPAA
jgi:uncharacterized protein (TIRG00374 family)